MNRRPSLGSASSATPTGVPSTEKKKTQGELFAQAEPVTVSPEQADEVNVLRTKLAIFSRKLTLMKNERFENGYCYQYPVSCIKYVLLLDTTSSIELNIRFQNLREAP